MKSPGTNLYTKSWSVWSVLKPDVMFVVVTERLQRYLSSDDNFYENKQLQVSCRRACTPIILQTCIALYCRRVQLFYCRRVHLLSHMKRVLTDVYIWNRTYVISQTCVVVRVEQLSILISPFIRMSFTFYLFSIFDH